MNYAETSALLTEWKRTEELAFLNEVSCVPLQQCLRHLQGAFVSFWKIAEPLAIVWSRPLPDDAEPTTVTVSRDSAGRWHVSLLVETCVEQFALSRDEVGIDLGLSALATLSTGEKIANPRHERRDRQRLARAQALDPARP